jgi:hypothetical protein
MHILAKFLKLLGAAALVFLLCHTVLPRLAKAPGFEVVRSNLRHDFDATAYFYTELDNFNEYEKAVRRDFSKRE